MSRLKASIWFAAASLVLIDALAYTFGALNQIRHSINPTDPYWQSRLLLNLMLANEGMYIGALAAFIGATLKVRRQVGANALILLTIVNCLYTLVTVPLLTPSDLAHTIPRALAALLIVVGFISTRNSGLPVR